MAFHIHEKSLERTQYRWLITGVAGFIGSHLLETLLNLNQIVIGLDNFVTGKRANLDEVRNKVGGRWELFTFIEGDIRDAATCRDASRHIDYILHHAAVGSVPLSMQNPLLTHEVNVTGFVNILTAARDNAVKRVIYASSSAIYGDNPNLPLDENEKPMPQSPYAASKLCNEVYAEAFYRSFGLESIGFRYFNVFGERQDPDGPYAAVIPRWIRSVIQNQSVPVYGNGQQTRDFLYVKNVVDANIAAAFADHQSVGQVFNVGHGRTTSLNELLDLITESAQMAGFKTSGQIKADYKVARSGDILHSCARVSKIKQQLNCSPEISVNDGLKKSILWYSNIESMH